MESRIDHTDCLQHKATEHESLSKKQREEEGKRHQDIPHQKSRRYIGVQLHSKILPLDDAESLIFYMSF